MNRIDVLYGRAEEKDCRADMCCDFPISNITGATKSFSDVTTFLRRGAVVKL